LNAPKIFKGTYSKMVDGKRVKFETPTWYVYIGRKKVSLGKDKKLAHIRSGELLKQELHKKEFGDLGLIDPFKEAEKTSVLEYLDQYHDQLKTRFSLAHANEQQSKIQKVVKLTKAIYLPEVTQPKLLAALNKFTSDKGLAAQTFNHYVAAVKAFFNFIDNELGALRVNPTKGIKKRNINDASLVHPRRASAPEEADFLVTATKGFAPHPLEAVSPIDRSFCYRLALQTGLRAKELSCLQPENFDLTKLTVTIQAAYSKNKRTDVLPISESLANTLEPWLKTKKPKTKLWAGAYHRGQLGKKLKKDMARARELYIAQAPTEQEAKKRQADDFLMWKDSSGFFNDFHSQRATYITNLAGLTPNIKEVQQLARHQNALTTMRYIKTTQAALVNLIGRMPDVGGPKA
jgi:integrase